jgi:hypothetical protein
MAEQTQVISVKGLGDDGQLDKALDLLGTVRWFMDPALLMDGLRAVFWVGIEGLNAQKKIPSTRGKDGRPIGRDATAGKLAIWDGRPMFIREGRTAEDAVVLGQGDVVRTNLHTFRVTRGILASLSFPFRAVAKPGVNDDSVNLSQMCQRNTFVWLQRSADAPSVGR